MDPEEEEAAGHGQGDDQVDGVLTAKLDGLTADDALQLAGRNERASSGERAEHDLEAESAAGDDAHLGAVGEELAYTDQGGGEGAKGVGERGPLRHGGHGNGDRQDRKRAV